MDLRPIAERVMREHGFEPTWPPAVTQQLADLAAHHTAPQPSPAVRDLRGLLWSSIDNDTTRDLDQLEVAERQADGTIRVLVAIADVDSVVAKDTPIDRHAFIETTSVYTGVRTFPMLPQALSEGETSLLEGQDRLAVVTELVVNASGALVASDVYRALVRNQAQLTYAAVGEWLEGRRPIPAKVSALSGLEAQLRLQDEAAQALCKARHRHGALNIETVGAQPLIQGGQVVGLTGEVKNRATSLIEDFMIAANEVVAQTLEKRGRSSIRRIVRTPAGWPRIVQIASGYGYQLPTAPDAKALNGFLLARRDAEPERFADLSLAIVKLMGPGEYVLERPGTAGEGHFGLAIDDYTHSTAPNRRFPDLVTQRLIKAMLADAPSPYTDAELEAIAHDCTVKQDAARKVERDMHKRIAAQAMSHRIGETFEAIVTGVKPTATFVRALAPHVEGYLARGREGVQVGDRLRVKLISTDVERGYIDFARE